MPLLYPTSCISVKSGLGELKGVVEERLRYYHESRLHSGLGYRTPKEVMEEALGQSMQVITREAG
jgi:transposase InsO family protein